jgi:TRAP-type mannitol/chloroaromatic compound transport system permease large subunit
MPTPTEKAEHAMSVLMRTGISIITPLWGVIMLVIGFRRESIASMLTGAAVFGVGALLMAGSPLAERALDIRESWRADK